jgi:hypothetical protein
MLKWISLESVMFGRRAVSSIQSGHSEEEKDGDDATEPSKTLT